MKLTGIVYSKTKSTAIIEWGGYSYIIGLNDNIGNSKWKATRIERDSITLDNGSESIVLGLTEKSDNVE
jgi:type II secretory pathway component PulC